MRLQAAILAIAFLTLTLCSMGAFMYADHAMGTCQFAPQLVTLCPPDIAGQLARLLTLASAMFLAIAVLTLITGSPSVGTQGQRTGGQRPPDILPPLTVAYSDGLIQPKVFGY